MAREGKPRRFKAPKQRTAPDNPEDLFYELNQRSDAFPYLRAGQDEILRRYAEASDAGPDVALELPTGTGKTAVGLLIADWRRRESNQPAAYLALTKQLAHRVIDEAKRLSIPVADLTGPRGKRDPAEEGRFGVSAAVGVATYASLFNTNPAVRQTNTLVFDDAHGGGDYAAGMWTVDVSSTDDKELYAELLNAIRPGLDEVSFRRLTNPGEVQFVELVDHAPGSTVREEVRAVLDQVDARQRFPWGLLRDHLPACLILASPTEIQIRPLLPPTWTHKPFAEAEHRVYMSATLGDDGDLLRAYGIRRVTTLRAAHQRFGRRYIFVPGRFVAPETAERMAAEVLDGPGPSRAVLLAPSKWKARATADALRARMAPKPAILAADDISESMTSFTDKDRAILAVGGRYDGLDLPHDSCRVLVMVDRPTAISPLERHLVQNWKMGPIYRGRERTRITQGLGRCTRDALDWAVVIWLGQTLVDAATDRAITDWIPAHVRTELAWGMEQAGVNPKDPSALTELMSDLLTDPDLRTEAEESLREYAEADDSQRVGPPGLGEDAARAEVRFAEALWDGDPEGAYRFVGELTDHLSSAELAGARGWWWYLGSVVAVEAGDEVRALDCLDRCVACNVNAGWLRRIKQRRAGGAPARTDEQLDFEEAYAEASWDAVARQGWSGPTFSARVARMKDLLGRREHRQFHEGLELLGELLGVEAKRPNVDGAPDVVWSLPDGSHIAFEAKTEKDDDTKLSKRDLTEASGHEAWVRANVCNGASETEINVVLVSTTAAVHETGAAFLGELKWVHPDAIRRFGEDVGEYQTGVRNGHRGHEFPAVASEIAAGLRRAGLTLAEVRERVLGTALRDVR